MLLELPKCDPDTQSEQILFKKNGTDRFAINL